MTRKFILLVYYSPWYW